MDEIYAEDYAFRRAQRAIAQARLSRLNRLNLSPDRWPQVYSARLRALPSSIGDLSDLRSLILAGNDLNTFPDSLRKLRQLQSLDLSGNELTELPEWLGDLAELRTLSLSRNKLTALPQSLSRLSRLQIFDLSQNRISELPGWIGQLADLQHLLLAYNQIADLPEPLEKLHSLRTLDVSQNLIRALPEDIGAITELRSLRAWNNRLTDLPQSLGRLQNLAILSISGNRFVCFPSAICELKELKELYASNNFIDEIPSGIGALVNLEKLILGGLRDAANLAVLKESNRVSALPVELLKLNRLNELNLDGNPLFPEFEAAYKEGLGGVYRYLMAQAEAQTPLNEAKLILVGEGEVGKSCLLGALRDDPWEEGRPTTHGIEIKHVVMTDPETGEKMQLNAWDFGGQRVYRPTHQLFFSAPAVYLVVWKPREGPQQGFVKEWIKLIKHREPGAKIIVVSTHGGPKQRQPDIDRQEVWDLFGRDIVVDFFRVDSKPNPETGERYGLKELQIAIAKVAASLPEMGRSFPKRWQEVRNALAQASEAYLPLERVLEICAEHGVSDVDSRLLIRITRRVGDLIHYEHDPTLRNIVVLKPDWLATAISLVLDDEETRRIGHGLVSFERLRLLWNDPDRPAENRYPAHLHPIFLKLMERFDLSYRVAEPHEADSPSTSLIAQLVPDVRPDPLLGWTDLNRPGDEQQVQICRIVDAISGTSANAEGLFYKLIVRLHKFSLGRANYAKSVHWQRGLVLEDDTGARAFLEHVGNDVRIVVRSPYPERFLSTLTYEVQWLVQTFWKGLSCEVTVPCLTLRPDHQTCTGLFEVTKLIVNKGRGRPEQPCPVCNTWQSVDTLLRNAPMARPEPTPELLGSFQQVLSALREVRRQLASQSALVIGRLDRLDARSRKLVSKVEFSFDALLRLLADEAKEGPRLFSLEPLEPGFWDQPKWMSTRLRLTLWCEHSRLPLPVLNGANSDAGIYELVLTREWLVKSTPFLQILTKTLGLVAPVAAAAANLPLDEEALKGIENQLDLGQEALTALSQMTEQADTGPFQSRTPDLQNGAALQAHGAVLRQLQTWLRDKDPGFGGLVRVTNKRHEYLWVHPRFEKEY